MKVVIPDEVVAAINEYPDDVACTLLGAAVIYLTEDRKPALSKAKENLFNQFFFHLKHSRKVANVRRKAVEKRWSDNQLVKGVRYIPTDTKYIPLDTTYIPEEQKEIEKKKVSSPTPLSIQKENNKEKREEGPPSPKKVEDEKVKFADYVKMRQKDYDALVERFGEPQTKRMIEILDNYKGSTGKTYKDDYRAILSWVVERYAEEQRIPQQQHNAQTIAEQRFAEREREREERERRYQEAQQGAVTYEDYLKLKQQNK